MKKQTVSLDEKGYQSNIDRLKVIAETVIGTLSDEVVLEILAERRSLEKENTLYEKQRDEENRRNAALIAERKALTEEIEELNVSITPDKDDDTLLSLVARRKELEAKLSILGEAGDEMSVEIETEEPVMKDASPEKIGETEGSSQEKEILEEEKVVVPPPIEVKVEPQEEISEKIPASDADEAVIEVKTEKKEKILDERIGGEKINMIISSTEAKEYLQLLAVNPDDALARLESLPNELKKEKSFMLKVAEIDPAYAMHYADSKTLKKDEDFNVKIAGMKNPRNSGNPLAEMLSESRTGKVVMAAVKNDFRNLRYATTDMEGYSEMLEIGKKEAREKVKALGQAVDLRIFLPKILREDRVFLEEVEGIVKGLKEQGKKTDA